MKILALMMLMVVGCGKGGEITIGEPPKAKPTDQNATKPTPTKGLTKEDVVGTYEAMYKGEAVAKYIIYGQRASPRHPEGYAELYLYSGQHAGIKSEGKWSINKDGELHLEIENGNILIHRANNDGSLTIIAMIQNASTGDDGDKPDASEQLGKRKDIPKGEQWTVKKIK